MYAFACGLLQSVLFSLPAGGGPCEHSDDGSSLNTEQSTREIYGLTESLLDTSEGRKLLFVKVNEIILFLVNFKRILSFF